MTTKRQRIKPRVAVAVPIPKRQNFESDSAVFEQMTVGRDSAVKFGLETLSVWNIDTTPNLRFQLPPAECADVYFFLPYRLRWFRENSLKTMSNITGNFGNTSSSSGISSYISSFGGEGRAQKEVLQQRHYFILSQLQSMAKELPPKFQQRLPNELLSDIAKSLLDGTVYDIVTGLKEIQLIAEKQLFTQRVKVVNRLKAEKLELQKKCKELIAECSATSPDKLPLVQQSVQEQQSVLQKRHKEETSKMDMKLIMELDQKVSDQQVTLEKSGVPGFFVTNNSIEVRLQMYLLDFVQRMSTVPLPV